MNSKLKTFGIALAVGLILTALAAASASAQFTSNKTHTIFSGSQEVSHEFTAGEGFGGITCESVTFSGTATETNEPDWRIVPTYSNCKDSFGRTVHIDNGNKIGENQLAYTFTPEEVSKTTSNVVVEKHGPEVHISGEMTLTVTSAGSVVCTVHIVVPQTANGITYHNLGGTTGVRVTANSSNVKSTTTGSFLGCGVSEGEHTEGTYTGTTVFTGKDTVSNPAAISVDSKSTTVHCS